MKKSNILVVVDYQNDFVTGSLGFEAAQDIEETLATKIRNHFDEGGTVIFTYDTHENDYMSTVEGKHLPVPHCIEGTEGWQLFGKVKEVHDWALKAGKNCYDVHKPTFGSLGLITVFEDLMDKGIAESEFKVEFTGVVTNICVISNAIITKSTLPEAEIIINSNLCASNDDEMEQKAFDILENLHIKVR